ncbi:class I SAM-dependent methyltransferase [Nocardioides nanhaiensis]|uniref:Class I SAM-dependent methyltransferase n=1 Tax=Nocardioides nanhaiensis TaxID=1476871 RepID=A0ABP8X281_9ACTN
MSQPTPADDATFERAWTIADTVPGWLTRDQARLLHDEAQALDPGAVALEIGSHQGRSTVVLAAALGRRGSRLVAMDPFVEGRLFGGATTRQKFERHVAQAGVAEYVELVPEYSTRARPGWSRPLDLLYIDGKHDYWTLSDDLRWAVHLPPGAAVLVHDAFSSIGVTLGLLRHVLFSRTLSYERRAGSLALFRVRPPRRADRVRMVAELPWWVRNVGIKVLLRLRLRPVARLVGHDSPYDPY